MLSIEFAAAAADDDVDDVAADDADDVADDVAADVAASWSFLCFRFRLAFLACFYSCVHW